ncbi:DUF805 domain-containing protein [Fructobacillus pseudoficulneus]|nr:DUF805 domain-containing protein [Fructobacillus pseudoficulneus]SEH46742.1 Uncharacterized membrane protein YhaH, DUF805 family [Fructobacillus pseudoficulneus]
MIHAYEDYWKEYLDFSGRSTRAEFWRVVFDNLILTLVVVVLTSGSLFGLFSQLLEDHFTGISLGVFSLSLVALVVSLFYGLATIIPNLALEYRRFMDTGLSKSWFILPILALVLPVLYLLTFNWLLLVALVVVEAVVLVVNLSKTGQFSKK